MRVPLSWLKDYVNVSLPTQELAQRLTMAGIEAAGVESIGGGWENIFVGRVLRVMPHPNADRLRLCEVDIGTERLTVVCGAPNVAEGQHIPFARVGARLADAHSGKQEVLRAARIRGVLSEGMVCSERELGLGEDHTGIVVLPEDAPVGMPLSDYLGDTVLELEVTTNRVDCLSLLGLAHEAAALTGGQVRLPSIAYPEEGRPVREQVAIEIADPALCPRYTAALVTGVRVGPSPRWMQTRLERAGLRPINNVVDITNYVMLEYGQPLHAFDFAAVQGSKIVVRQARPGELLVTLDGQQRKLAPPMLVIADAQDAIALAGVMGGAGSEITQRTTEVLLESASFDPVNTRRTAATLRLPTEASRRFERGLRPELPAVALRRAAQLIHELAGGSVAPGTYDVYPGSRPQPVVRLAQGRLHQVLGAAVPQEQVQRVLTALGFRCQPDGQDALQVAVPYWRSDITIPDDLVEEVARIVGYDQVPTVMLSTPIPHHQPNPQREIRERVRDLLVAAGLQEVITYSLVSQEALARVRANSEAPLRAANPLNPEWEYLRTTLRPGLLGVLVTNRRHEAGPVRLFEIGRVYQPRPGDLPIEREIAAGLLSGPRTPEGWLKDDGELSFYDAKGVVQAVLESLGAQAAWQEAADPSLRPGRAALVVAGGTTIGTVGEVDPHVLEQFDLPPSPVALLELDLAALYQATPTSRPVRPTPRFPGALRDLALLVDLAVPAAQVHRVIAQHPLVSQVTLFDVYVGPQVPAGKRSLAYHVQFQAPDRTLMAAEVNEALEEIVEGLKREVGATIRGT
ncbi:MAG: phenylalanine--tRNA ligase subunit beta [Chloroflexi bacterium]|nr:phenylalanine--tRNA ligase subunit beta [Chloroflexota bacterium]